MVHESKPAADHPPYNAGDDAGDYGRGGELGAGISGAVAVGAPEVAVGLLLRAD
jgi:hypothetical protein